MKTSTFVALAVLVACLAGAVGAGDHGAQGFLTASSIGNSLMPDAVARTLLSVEEEWKAQASAFAECEETSSKSDEHDSCSSAGKAFARSCSTVVSAVVSASSGKRADVEEYMADVCGEHELQGWHEEQCQKLSKAITHAMSSDEYDNRQGNDISGPLCSGLWSELSEEEKGQMKKDQADEQAQKEADDKKAVEQRKVQEEAESKKAEEAKAAAAKKQAEAEKKAAKRAEEAAEMKAAEQAKKKLAEATEKAEEAKKKAEDAEAAKKKAEQSKKEAEQAKETADAAKKEVTLAATAQSAAVPAAKPAAVPVAKKA